MTGSDSAHSMANSVNMQDILEGNAEALTITDNHSYQIELNHANTEFTDLISKRPPICLTTSKDSLDDIYYFLLETASRADAVLHAEKKR